MSQSKLNPISERLAMVDKSNSKLSIKGQCKLLGISRSSFYYKSVHIDEQGQKIIFV
jgi:hypothetical protein